MSEASSSTLELIDYLVSYAGLISLATISIYAGSFASLKLPKSKSTRSPDKDYEDEDEGLSEEIRLEDAYWLPILGSVVLFSLYIIIRYISVKWINIVLQWYFSIITVASLWTASRNFMRFCLGTTRWRQLRPLTLSITHGDQPLVHLRTPTITLFLLPFVLYPSIVYIFFPSIMESQHAVLINIMGLSLTHTALVSIKLDSLITGVVLLSGLFLYDIWWVFGSKPVFGSNVMVTVAQGLDAPIKILFPKSRHLLGNDYTMLGLGDIVVPGMFIAFALRYDLHRSAVKDLGQRFAKPFFIATLISYIVGLATTVVVMHTFHSAQPALLYLSPACILSFLATGLIYGEWAEIWAYSDTQEEQNDAGDQKEKVD